MRGGRLPDDEWGQIVAAALVLRPGAQLDLKSLRSWAKERLAPYKVPSALLICDQLPRNPMGKLIKPELAGLFDGRFLKTEGKNGFAEKNQLRFRSAS